MHRLVYVERRDLHGKRKRRVLTVEHNVTRDEVRNSRGGKTIIFTAKGGRYLFRGLWYGDKDPRKQENFGKVEGQVGVPVGKVVGGRISPFLRKRMQD